MWSTATKAWQVRGPLAAQPGDALVFTGPGGAYNPAPGADWYLFAGDDAAIPAIAAAIESLPADARGIAFLEVDSDADILPIAAPTAWSCAGCFAPESPPDPARSCSRPWAKHEWLPGRVDVFAHGERGYMKGLRDIFFNQRGLERSQVSLSGYWAQGRVEDDFQAEKKLPIGQI